MSRSDEDDTEHVNFDFTKNRIKNKFWNGFASPTSALLILSIAHMLQQTVMSGLLGVCISTLEKRFELRSTESGAIGSCFDLASVIAVILIAIAGEDLHKPRLIGGGVMVAAFGTLLFTLPHFLAPEYSFYEVESYNYCKNVTSPDCTTTKMRDYRFIFFASIAIIGIGANPLYNFAITFLDENVEKEKSGLYNGIYYAFGGFGPALGYLFGGATLELFTYIGSDTGGITSDSYLWIGAWWFGFVVCGLLLGLIAIPLSLLPRNLPGTDKCREGRDADMQRTMLKWNISAEEKKEISTLQLRIQSFKVLLRNKPFLYVSLAGTVNCAFIYGFNTFGAKYLESEFGLSAFHSSVLYGVTAIFGATGAQIVSGIVMTKFKFGVTGNLRYMIGCGIFSALCSLGFFVHCPDIVFAGGTEPYINDTLKFQPFSNCNEICGCSTDLYEPVCANGITYFSPCYAGCQARINDTAYTNCTCIYDATAVASTDSCSKEPCNLIIPFAFVVFLCFFSSIMTLAPAIQVTMRCVPFEHRTIALAFQNALILVAGVFPGRLLTGLVLDFACVTWSSECGDQGSCRSYKRWELARNTASLLLAQTTVVVLLYVLVYKSYKPAETADHDAEIERETGQDQETEESRAPKSEGGSGHMRWDGENGPESEV